MKKRICRPDDKLVETENGDIIDKTKENTEDEEREYREEFIEAVNTNKDRGS